MINFLTTFDFANFIRLVSPLSMQYAIYGIIFEQRFRSLLTLLRKIPQRDILDFVSFISKFQNGYIRPLEKSLNKQY